MTKGTQHDLLRASLSDLIGHSRAVALVMAPRRVPIEDLAAACLEVRQQLCPFPALSLADWFWSGVAGQSLAVAEWILYAQEAMFPLDVQRALFGKTAKRAERIIAGLFRKGALTAYGIPVNVGAARQTRGAIYARRSDVLRLWESRQAQGEKLPYPEQPHYRLREKNPQRDYLRAYQREIRRRQLTGHRNNPGNYRRCQNGSACKSQVKTRPYLEATAANFFPSATTEDGWSELCITCTRFRNEQKRKVKKRSHDR